MFRRTTCALLVGVLAAVFGISAISQTTTVDQWSIDSIEWESIGTDGWTKMLVGTNGLVSSNHQLASNAGALMLALGGNAIDAAVATGFAIAVTEPNASNIGGEGYMVIGLADGRNVAIDFRSWSQGHVTIETETSSTGVNSTLIPGLVAGLALAHEEFGTLPWSVVLAPAIRLASEGFPIDGNLHSMLSSLYRTEAENPVIASVYFPNGFLPDVGTILVQEDMARTLRLIAEHGPKVFYRGEIAQAIVEVTGGRTRSQDLQRYAAILRETVTTTYRGYTIVGAPPIVSGVQICEALNILELFDMGGYDGWYDPIAVHLVSQALLLSAADRMAHVADPDFYDVPIAGLLSKAYAAERASLIDLEQAIVPASTPVGDPYKYMDVDSTSSPTSWWDPEEAECTTHYSVADAYGNAVAVTQTLSSHWGSRIMVPGYGFFLSNHLVQFSSDPTALNVMAPYKRSSTVLAPTIVRHPSGYVHMVLGTPGGGYIPTTVLGTLVNLLDHGMSPLEAVLAPRLYSVPTDARLFLEQGYPQETIQRLEALGHTIYLRPYLNTSMGGVNLIVVDEDGVMTGVATFTRDGGVAGP